MAEFNPQLQEIIGLLMRQIQLQELWMRSRGLGYVLDAPEREPSGDDLEAYMATLTPEEREAAREAGGEE